MAAIEASNYSTGGGVLITIFLAAFSFANLAAAFAFNFLIKSDAFDLDGIAAATTGFGYIGLTSAFGASTAGAGSVVPAADFSTTVA